jgi:hypothetical protein
MAATPRIKAALDGIKAYWDSASCANARAIATDGLWLSRVAEGKVTAFVVVTPVGGSVDRTMGTIDTDRLSVEFLCHVEDDDSGAVLVAQLADALTEAFDNAALTISGWTSVYCLRQSSPLVVEDPEKGWNAMVEYAIEFG